MAGTGKGEATGKAAHEPARGQPSEGGSELVRPIIRRMMVVGAETAGYFWLVAGFESGSGRSPTRRGTA
jgi:hypothetical protein